jgi:hypothetical protein
VAYLPEVRPAGTRGTSESVNAWLRKVTGHRCQFPTEQAALRVLCLAVGMLGEYRGATVGI